MEIAETRRAPQGKDRISALVMEANGLPVGQSRTIAERGQVDGMLAPIVDAYLNGLTVDIDAFSPLPGLAEPRDNRIRVLGRHLEDCQDIGHARHDFAQVIPLPKRVRKRPDSSLGGKIEVARRFEQKSPSTDCGDLDPALLGRGDPRRFTEGVRGAICRLRHGRDHGRGSNSKRGSP